MGHPIHAVAGAIAAISLHFRHSGKVLLVAICLPFSMVDGFCLTYWLGYNLSVAVGVGFIVRAGVAAEFCMVMLLYIDKAIGVACQSISPFTRSALREAIVQGALLRARPKAMTVAVIVAGLLQSCLAMAPVPTP